MSSEKEYMAADLRGPLTVWTPTTPHPRGVPGAEMVALNLTASGVAQQFDLAASGFFGAEHFKDRFCRMIPESTGHIWYAYAVETGAVVDRTITGGGTGVCALLPSLTFTDEVPAGRYLVIQPQGSGIVRLWITNRTS